MKGSSPQCNYRAFARAIHQQSIWLPHPTTLMGTDMQVPLSQWLLIDCFNDLPNDCFSPHNRQCLSFEIHIHTKRTENTSTHKHAFMHTRRHTGTHTHTHTHNTARAHQIKMRGFGCCVMLYSAWMASLAEALIPSNNVVQKIWWMGNLCKELQYLLHENALTGNILSFPTFDSNRSRQKTVSHLLHMWHVTVSRLLNMWHDMTYQQWWENFGTEDFGTEDWNNIHLIKSNTVITVTHKPTHTHAHTHARTHAHTHTTKAKHTSS